MIALGYTGQFFILYFSIFIHEMAHILIAFIFKRKCEKIVFMPFGLYSEIASIEELGIFKKCFIFIFPPILNLIFGVIFFKHQVGKINLCLGIFNLLPIYPLDFARFLECVVGYFIGSIKGVRVVFKTGKIFMAFLFLFIIVESFIFEFSFLSFFLCLYLYREFLLYDVRLSYIFYSILFKKNNRKSKKRVFFISKEKSLKEVIKELGFDFYSIFYVDGKIICEEKILEFIKKRGLNFKMEDIFFF